MIVSKALSIWETPVTDCQPLSTVQEMVIYDGTQTFLGNKINGYTFLDGDYQPVNTWKEFMVDIVKTLSEQDMSKILELVNSDETGLIESKFVTSFPAHFNDRVSEISPGIYFIINYTEKMMILSRLFEMYEIDVTAKLK